MKTSPGSKWILAGAILAWAALAVKAGPLAPLGPEPAVPAFSISYMDRSISPGTNFYSFANGQWIKGNPVPPDQATWDGRAQLEQHNSYLIHALL
jgi:putative endopeptidase